jgi:prepilin-type N-terminal cleavage/methylation domain-containing protein
MHRTRHAFTFTEMMVALSVFATVSMGLFTFTATSLRLVGRNLATNHTHENMRISDQELLYNLHASASPYVLITYNGTTYADATATATTDVDAYTQQNISNRTNGVRFRLAAGGPYQLTASTTSASTSLTFNFAVGSTVPYVPEVGDKVVLPLLSSAFDILAVTQTPSTGSPTGTVTISAPSRLRRQHHHHGQRHNRLLLSRGRLHRLQQPVALSRQLHGQQPGQLRHRPRRRHFAQPLRVALCPGRAGQHWPESSALPRVLRHRLLQRPQLQKRHRHPAGRDPSSCPASGRLANQLHVA